VESCSQPTRIHTQKRTSSISFHFSSQKKKKNSLVEIVQKKRKNRRFD
jgi:hypothetical protein